MKKLLALLVYAVAVIFAFLFGVGFTICRMQDKEMAKLVFNDALNKSDHPHDTSIKCKKKMPIGFR